MPYTRRRCSAAPVLPPCWHQDHVPFRPEMAAACPDGDGGLHGEAGLDPSGADLAS
ncbi:hypothetical protein [Zymomonas mobilis]|uniref:hypothetical protein n=1 Tax=Zymomonas mobilis TaxID=542 RepID=UPI00131EED58|nr:hypothetical protein [Zymomonas mobilis]